MVRLPCGHSVVDPTGTFCAHPGCGVPLLHVEKTADFLHSETIKDGKPYHVEALPDGLIRAALDLRNPNRRRFNELFVAGGLAFLATVFEGTSLSLDWLEYRRRERQNVRDWGLIISDIDRAIETPDGGATLRQLATAFRAHSTP